MDIDDLLNALHGYMDGMVTDADLIHIMEEVLKTLKERQHE